MFSYIYFSNTNLINLIDRVIFKKRLLNKKKSYQNIWVLSDVLRRDLIVIIGRIASTSTRRWHRLWSARSRRSCAHTRPRRLKQLVQRLLLLLLRWFRNGRWSLRRWSARERRRDGRSCRLSPVVASTRLQRRHDLTRTRFRVFQLTPWSHGCC